MQNDRELSLRNGIEIFQRRWPVVRSQSTHAPIVLMASGYRSGSTLVQRMFSRDCLIWGEPYGEGGLLDSAPDLIRRLRDGWPDQGFFHTREDVRPRSDRFIANLYPSPQRLLDSYVCFFESLFVQSANEAGMERWGIKTVRYTADHAHFLRWLFPQAHFLFLVRSPYDAFRSYQAIRHQRNVVWFNRWPDRLLDTLAFGSHWRKLVSSFLQQQAALDAELIRYEDVISGRCDLSALASQFGTSIDRQALNSNPGGWPQPEASLDVEQLEILRQQVEPLAEQLGYTFANEPAVPVPDGAVPPRAKRGVDSDEVVAEAGDADRFIQQAMAAHQAGNSDAAERLCEHILQKHPDHAGAWHLTGLLRMSEGNYQAAQECLARAAQLCDTKPVYHNNYGVVLLQLEQHAEAEQAFRRAIELNVSYADAWSNLGHVQHTIGRLPQEAESSLREALRLQPEHADATLHLADVCRDRQALDEAIELWRKWISRHGESASVLKKLGLALVRHGDYEPAKTAIARAMTMTPEDPELPLSLGSLESAWGHLPAAKQAFERAARLMPMRSIVAWKHLADCPSIFANRQAIDRYWRWLDHELDEARQARPTMDWRSLPFDGFTPPFNLPHHGRCCRAIKEKFSSLFQSAFSQSRPTPRPGLPGRRRVRVGFLVTAGHEAGFIRGTAGIIERLHADRFETVLFCAQQSVKRIRKSFQRTDLAIVPLPRRFDQAVQVARTASCDVIYFWKVGADTWNQFLPITRLAPIQCTSWGTHGTSGVEAVDYYLSSELIESDELGIDVNAQYSEGLLLLPTLPTWQIRQAHRKPASRNEFGLASTGAIYFCPHRPAKYHPDFDAYLRDVLQADPDGQLVLLSGQRAHDRDLLRARLLRHLGSSLFRRVHILPAMPLDRYYPLLNLATVVLDSPVYAGGITAYDAFSYGIPVVTQPGTLAVQNYTAGLYRRMGISGMTAANQQQFVEIAGRLGTESDFREDCSTAILERGEAIFEDRDAVTAIESFLFEMTRQEPIDL